MNDWWRPSWTWRCLQSACRCTGPTRIDPPLLEFVLGVYAPPPTSPLHVNSLTTLPPPFGQLLPHSRRVPPLWFLTTPAGSSVQRPRVCCTPKPDEVRYVSRFRAHRWPTEADDQWVLVPFPATRFTPLEEYPSSVAVPRHRGRYPLVVLSVTDRPNTEVPETDPNTVPTSRRCKGTPLPKRWVCRLPRRRGSRVCPVSRSPRCARQTILATLPARNTLTHADPSCRRSDWAGPAAPRCLRSEELGP